MLPSSEPEVLMNFLAQLKGLLLPIFLIAILLPISQAWGKANSERSWRECRAEAPFAWVAESSITASGTTVTLIGEIHGARPAIVESDEFECWLSSFDMVVGEGDVSIPREATLGVQPVCVNDLGQKIWYEAVSVAVQGVQKWTSLLSQKSIVDFARARGEKSKRFSVAGLENPLDQFDMFDRFSCDLQKRMLAQAVADSNRGLSFRDYLALLRAYDRENSSELKNAMKRMDRDDICRCSAEVEAAVFKHRNEKFARRILEIGTLGGYSTIWMARALPAGGLICTLEADPHHAAVAKTNLDRAGVTEKVNLRVGPALETLQDLLTEETEPFDLVFIDADKPSNPDYLAWSLKLTRPGSLIIGDNVVRNGQVIDDLSDDPRVQGVRTFTDLIASNPNLLATALQTVGAKGWDGFVVALVVEPAV